MRQKLCFVQFLHPGVEHRPDGAGLGWNRGQHRRRFMVGRGRYLEEGSPTRGSFTFWGEWEAGARLVGTFDGSDQGPRFLFEPFFRPPRGYSGLQNTDPFVFGERFHYTGCLQHTKRGPTQLRYLSPGSVVLFGSCVAGRFALDTLFVVADFIDHSVEDRDRLTGRISGLYREVTVEPWYANLEDHTRSYRLYFGATYENQVAGMFSFVPCLPVGERPRAFRRPVIDIEDLITPGLKQGKRLNPLGDVLEARRWWQQVVDQVREAGLGLAVQIDEPSSVQIDEPPGKEAERSGAAAGKRDGVSCG